MLVWSDCMVTTTRRLVRSLMFSHTGHPHLLCPSCKFEMGNWGPVCIPGASNIPHASNSDFTASKAFCCHILVLKSVRVLVRSGCSNKVPFHECVCIYNILYLSMYKTIFFLKSLDWKSRGVLYTEVSRGGSWRVRSCPYLVHQASSNQSLIVTDASWSVIEGGGGERADATGTWAFWAHKAVKK